MHILWVKSIVLMLFTILGLDFIAVLIKKSKIYFKLKKKEDVSGFLAHGSYISRIMRKPAFCICERKGYIDSTISLLPESKMSNLL